MRLLISLLICMFIVGCASQRSSDYITLHAKVDGQPVRLAIDTGSSNLTLFNEAAQRLGLEASEPAENLNLSPVLIPLGYSEQCRLSSPDINIDEDVIFTVFDVPPNAEGMVPFDGVIGWENIECNILLINVEKKIMAGLSKLPEDIESWSKWAIYEDPDSSVLLIKVLDLNDQDGVIIIDTGSPSGVSLNARRWNKLKDSQEDQPYTLNAYYTPAVGSKVYEQRWADTLDIGGFTVSDVPVQPSDRVWKHSLPNYQAMLGLFALSRLEVIIDGPGGTVYTRPRKNPQSVYYYNRAGAEFLPKDDMSDQLIAHVIDNGPAYQAGLRNGDILLGVDGQDVGQWQTDPEVLPGFRDPREGTKIELTVMRDDETISVMVELIDIFPRDNAEDNSKKQNGSSGEINFSFKPIVFCEESNILEKTNRDRQAAEQGDADAQYQLGLYYARGQGLPRDYNEAFKWWSAAAEQGNADAQMDLGIMYLNGNGVEKDYIKAVEFFTEAALQGNANAQCNLGAMYLNGDGIEKDYTKAFKLFTEAAEQGNTLAQCNLGVMYLSGYGVEKDYTKAFELFTEAALQEVADAQYNLGVMYRDGIGVEQDFIKAVELFTEPALKGDPQAQINLGNMFLNGLGVERDYTKALALFTRAIEKANTPVLAIAQANLGLMYLQGFGVEKDYAKAFELFTQVVEQGNTSVLAGAQASLSFMYMNGYGVDQNYVEAYKWVLLAGINGDYNYQRLRLLESKMTPKQIAEGRRLANEYLEQKKREEVENPSTTAEVIRINN